MSSRSPFAELEEAFARFKSEAGKPMQPQPSWHFHPSAWGSKPRPDICLFCGLTPAQKPAWPNTLNPCPYAGRHPVPYPGRPLSKTFWGVQGRVTQLCVGCVWEAEVRFKQEGSTDPRRDALTTFLPDPKGNPTL